MTTKKILSLGGLLLAAVLSGCVSEGDAVQNITGPVPGARIKFFNFSVNAPAVNFYANDQKMTAISSATGTESTIGVGYGGVGAGGLYTGINPGQYTLTGKIAAATDKDLAVSSLQTALAQGKAYSYYMSGQYSTDTKTTDSFILEDALPAPSYSVAYVRFVNAVSNADPMVLYATSTVSGTETAVGAAIPYKSGGAFVALPEAVYNLTTRAAGGTAALVSRTGVSFSAGRIYTVTVRGSMTATLTAQKPFLDASLNY